MPEKLMSQVDIARRADCSEVSLNYIIKRKPGRFCGRQLAQKLERVTGVAREAWIWPDRWYNPYIEDSNPRLPKAEEIAGKIQGPEVKRKPKEKVEEPEEGVQLFGYFGEEV